MHLNSVFNREQILPTGPWNVHTKPRHGVKGQNSSSHHHGCGTECYEGGPPSIRESCRSKEAEEGSTCSQGVQDGYCCVDGYNLAKLREGNDDGLGEGDGGYDGGEGAADDGHTNVADGRVGAPLTQCVWLL